MRFTYTLMEEYVMKLFMSIGVHHPRQLNKERIASRLGFSLIYLPQRSINANEVLFLDDRLSEEKQWEEFCHELCHLLWHSGNQFGMSPPFCKYQEWQANSFALHACVPTYMLLDMNLPRDRKKAIWEIQRTFNVTYEFAQVRLEKFVQNHTYTMIS